MTQQFVYQARDSDGQMQTGRLTAARPADAAAYLLDKGYVVIDIWPYRQAGVQQVWQRFSRVSLQQLAVLYWRFSILVDAGIPVLAALDMLSQQTVHAGMKQTLTAVARQVAQGDMLSSAMAAWPSVFPKLAVSLVAAGEASGKLDEMLQRLARHFETQHKLRQQLQSALLYPAVVLIVCCFAVIFILTFVLPVFIQMLVQLQVALPLPTRLLMAVSQFLQNYWVWVLGVVVAGVALGAWCWQQPVYRRAAEHWFIRLPTIGLLLRKMAIARFCRILAILLRSGVPLLSALELVKKSLNLKIMADQLDAVGMTVIKGQSLLSALAATALFTSFSLQMIAVGEQTGRLDVMLDKTADFYEKETRETARRISGLLEPLLIIVMGGVIGAVVLAVMLPMFDAMTSTGR